MGALVYNDAQWSRKTWTSTTTLFALLLRVRLILLCEVYKTEQAGMKPFLWAFGGCNAWRELALATSSDSFQSV